MMRKILVIVGSGKLHGNTNHYQMNLFGVL